MYILIYLYRRKNRIIRCIEKVFSNFTKIGFVSNILLLIIEQGRSMKIKSACQNNSLVLRFFQLQSYMYRVEEKNIFLTKLVESLSSVVRKGLKRSCLNVTVVLQHTHMERTHKNRFF